MSFADLFTIYCNLLSSAHQINRLYEDWDFGRQKQEAEMARHWAKKSAMKIYDLLMDEYPECEEMIENLRGSASMARENVNDSE